MEKLTFTDNEVKQFQQKFNHSLTGPTPPVALKQFVKNHFVIGSINQERWLIGYTKPNDPNYTTQGDVHHMMFLVKFGPYSMNGRDVVNGGAIAALLDTFMAIVINLYGVRGTATATLTCNYKQAATIQTPYVFHVQCEKEKKRRKS